VEKMNKRSHVHTVRQLWTLEPTHSACLTIKAKNMNSHLTYTATVGTGWFASRSISSPGGELWAPESVCCTCPDR